MGSRGPNGQQDAPTVTARSSGESREKSTPPATNHTRFGVVLPLCVIVALAILCIVIAALTSAQRANDIAVEHEREMFENALTSYGESSLRKLKTVIAPNEGENQSAPANLERIIQRVRSAYKTMFDHDFVLVTDSNGNLVHCLINTDDANPEMLPQAFAEIAPMLTYLRGLDGAAPERITWLVQPGRFADGTIAGEAAYLQTLSSGVSVIVSIAIESGNALKPGGDESPAVLALQVVDDALLAEISNRLQLDHLHWIGNEPVPASDYVFNLRGQHGQHVARFVWTPQRPAAEVLNSVLPFITIAIVGFAFLTAYVLRYMRRTAAAIAAGEDRLRHLALHDPLSGLPNRACFGEALESTIVRVRQGGPPTAMLYLDLDHFKDVNDTLGHSIGDELIRSVTQRLANTLRGDDLVARLGGDEFAIITTASADHALLQSIARRIIAALCAPYMVGGNTIVIGASIGIVVIDRNSSARATDLMRYADMALYRAKNEGRNRACIYDHVMDADLIRRKQLEQDLRNAIENDELHVVYQPVVNASGEKIVGVEALARWSHPERGFISPVEFIPLAEHSGLIIELGEWVLRRACHDGKAWPKLSVAVNVSPVQFRQADFVEAVERVLAETGFDPKRLELEVTESTLIGNVEIAESAMLRLKALGIRFALDDFGTGYSSLHYLRRFPFDKLKIDRSFVLSIEKTADAAAIVHAIVSLGRGLGMKVTAEGVETAEQHLFLRAAGVHFMQGYRFSKPCSAADIGVLLKTPSAFRGIDPSAVAAMAS
jgi:diguanylate cyclase